MPSYPKKTRSVLDLILAQPKQGGGARAGAPSDTARADLGSAMDTQGQQNPLVASPGPGISYLLAGFPVSSGNWSEASPQGSVGASAALKNPSSHSK